MSITGRCYCGASGVCATAAPQTVAYCHCVDCRRWTCATCGSPLAARFDYLPGQIYVPIGILDQAAELAPQLHCHAAQTLPWLCLNDDLPRSAGSARAVLTANAGPT